MDTHTIIASVWQLPIEGVVAAAIASISIFDTIRASAARSAAITLALPLSILFYAYLPKTFLLQLLWDQFNSPTGEAVIFGAVFIAVTLIAYRITSFYDTAYGSILLAILTALALLIMLVVTWLQVPALAALWHPSPAMQAVFAESYRLWWTLGALAIMAFVRS